MTPPWLAIVIPVRNGMRTLPKLVDALDVFAKAEGLEVLFVDDASSDDTVAFLRQRGYEVLERSAQGGPAAARNQGVRATSAPWVLFLDADTVPPANTLERIKRALPTSDVVAVVGVYAAEPANPGFWPEYKATQVQFYHCSTDVTEISFVWASMAGVKRDPFLKAGAFDETYRGAELEDVELGHRMARFGKIVLDRELVVGHHFADTLRSNARDHFHRGRLWVNLYLRGGRFENYICTPGLGASRFALVAVPALLVLGFVSATAWPLLAVATASAAFYYYVTGGLYSLAWRRGGLAFALKILAAELVLSAVLVAASVSAGAATARQWFTTFAKRSATPDSDG